MICHLKNDLLWKRSYFRCNVHKMRYFMHGRRYPTGEVRCTHDPKLLITPSCVISWHKAFLRLFWWSLIGVAEPRYSRWSSVWVHKNGAFWAKDHLELNFFLRVRTYDTPCMFWKRSTLSVRCLLFFLSPWKPCVLHGPLKHGVVFSKSQSTEHFIVLSQVWLSMCDFACLIRAAEKILPPWNSLSSARA